MVNSHPVVSIKEFRSEQWKKSVSSLKKEIRPIYESIIKALIENQTLTHYQHRTILGKKIPGIRIVHLEDKTPDIVFGKSSTAFLRRYLPTDLMQELGILNFDSTQIDIFANIYAGIIDTRINSKQAYQVANNRRKYGLDIINEEKLAKTVASKIINEHYDKVENLSYTKLFNLGKQIASPKQISLIEPYIDQKHTQALIEQKINTIITKFGSAMTQKRLSSSQELRLNQSISNDVLNLVHIKTNDEYITPSTSSKFSSTIKNNISKSSQIGR
ncbi:hypothetical protein NOVO_08055 [Rickettsiales bacterium Ac37b]|nr:hypothetical protein NOVO_08055 [Rickettsiales bacterium Ac37b]